jgi:hypothetical protein
MPTAWLTYAWEDNDRQDVDFIAQELQRSGVTIQLDRWNISAGRRLWEQIAGFIQSPECSGWIVYATQKSLGSNACKEEFAYALDKALHARSETFPIVALFPSPVDRDLVPVAIRTRLHVSSRDPDWKERIKATLEGRAPQIPHTQLDPYDYQVHVRQYPDGMRIVLEVRPRAGTWVPFCAAILIEERERVQPSIWHGPRGVAGVDQPAHVLMNCGESPSTDGKYWMMFAGNEATPTQSYFISLRQPPSRVFFGIHNGPMFDCTVNLG